ncbi:hypothetical protein [Clostridium ihumii]|uniref:hypothetical protein n=1 Tax=Clostridium ihumii TaxID=1470356 RepID=UPI000B31FA35|nr:hypothetical protein [Clostridium ihumii]
MPNYKDFDLDLQNNKLSKKYESVNRGNKTYNRDCGYKTHEPDSCGNSCFTSAKCDWA